MTAANNNGVVRVLRRTAKRRSFIRFDRDRLAQQFCRLLVLND
jgi:hypothetical protein